MQEICLLNYCDQEWLSRTAKESNENICRANLNLGSESDVLTAVIAHGPL